MHAYEEILPSIDTGDLVLFSGKGKISTSIRMLTQCKWSHLGMALRLPEWDVPVLWESTVENNVADIQTGRVNDGVQLTSLRQRLAAYEGATAIRHLHVERTAEMYSALRALLALVKGRPYERDNWQLFKSAYEGPFGTNEKDLSSLFCSELVAEAYQCMGLLPREVPSNEYTPGDFCETGSLPLLDGSLGPELLVTCEPDPDAGEDAEVAG